MMGFWFISVLVSLFFSLGVSAPVWLHSPLPHFVQFPWRFLALTAFALAVGVSRMPKKIGIIVTILIVLFARPYLKTGRIFQPESYYTTNDDTTTVKNEYLSSWLKLPITNRPVRKLKIIEGEGEVLSDTQVVALTPIRLAVNTMYFPGWKLRINGKEVPIDYLRSGLIETNLPKGQYDIRTTFKETPIRMLANGVSLVSLAAILLGLRKKKYG